MAFGNTKQSNITGLAIAEEASLQTLPGTPVWYAQEPNDYSDFGGDLTLTTREPISATRQNKKGAVTDLSAAGGFTMDFTQNNLLRLLQGFMFADAIEKAKTQPLNGTQIPVTDVAVSGAYNAASGLTAFGVGDLVFASGFTNSANNGLSLVTVVTATTLTTDAATVLEVAPPSDAKIEAVGFEFASGDVALTVVAGLATLTSATVDMTTLGLTVGEFVFLGGDAAGDQFANGTGYFRIEALTSTTIVFDKATDLKIADAGAGQTVRLFFGTYLRNATTASGVVCRSYQLERQLGNDGVGIQSEYVKGCAANELSFSIESASKVTVDLGYVGLDVEQRTGTEAIKSGTRVAALGEEFFNTTSDVLRVNLGIVDASTLSPDNLFDFVQTTSLTIANNVNALKRIGALGGFDFSIGNFVVSGSSTAYFTTVAAISAIRNNTDVTLDLILARENGGLVFDIPLLAVGGGKPNVAKDEPITVPLDNQAAENSAGYTLGVTHFGYLPTVAMPA